MTEIKVPAVGESITEATIGEWVKKSGDYVNRDEILLLLETDKATVEVVAEESGLLTTTVGEGETVEIGAVIGSIDPTAKAPAGASKPAKKVEAPAAGGNGSAQATPPPPPVESVSPNAMHLSPAVRRVVDESGIDPSRVSGTGRGGRLTKADVMQAAQGGLATATSAPMPQTPTAPVMPAKQIVPGTTERVKMTTIRKKIAERLVQAQHTAAILTTFNEVDMGPLLTLRAKYKDDFEKRYGVRLGFMGFYVKAAVQALKEFPEVNAFIEGSDILYNHFYNIGIAVSSPKGLVVPVVKGADQLSLAEIEIVIRDFAVKARDGKITIEDMSGGTFTISNGGVFGDRKSVV